jgi:hypothetical protein
MGRNMTQTDGRQKTTDIDIKKSETAVDNEITLKMLLFSKMLFNHGINHSNKNTYLDRFLAIHHFDNAIELFLKTIVIKENITIKKELPFRELWGTIDKELSQKTSGSGLPLRDQIFALRDARNLAQHQGDATSFESVMKYQGYAKDFLSKCSMDIFNIDFNKIYASSLIEDMKIKETLIESEKYIERHNFKNAMESSAKAFVYLKWNERDDPLSHDLGHFTLFRGVLNERQQIELSGSYSFDGLEQKINKQIKIVVNELNELLKERAKKINEVARALGSLELKFAILKLGVDYKEYKHFDKISPFVLFESGSTDIASFEEKEEENYSEENARFCHDFVLEAALRLQVMTTKDKIDNKGGYYHEINRLHI